MDWKIYYQDETTYSDEDGSWEDAPADGVICVIVRGQEGREKGRLVYNRTDYYNKLPGGGPLDIQAVSDLGPFIRQYVKAIKFGAEIPYEDYMKILIKATKDDDFERVI
jgi:hypothetical protein